MRTYEMMFILKPDLTDEDKEAARDRLLKVIAEFGGEYISELPGWGKKRLAYSIEDYSEGIYAVWHFQGETQTVNELDRVIKISDKILRHIIIRLDEK